MDDLMAGIGGPDGMNDINELAKQAEQALQPRSNNVQSRQSAGYGNAQNSYGQQSTGYSSAQNSYGQQSAGYSNAQSGYGQQSTGYSNAQNGYGQQSADYGDTQSGYGQRSADHKGEPQYTPTPDFYAAYNDKPNNDTDFMVIVKGALGAMIGAIPGFFFIMMLARFGLIASICGTVLAAGVFFGYYLGTRKNRFDIKKCGIVCGAVMIIAIFIAVRASWTYKLRDSLKLAKSLSYSYMDMTDMTAAEVDEAMSSSYQFLIGDDDPTYSNCSVNFHKLLAILNLRGKFYGSLGENYLFCAIGALWLLSKFGKKDY